MFMIFFMSDDLGFEGLEGCHGHLFASEHDAGTFLADRLIETGYVIPKNAYGGTVYEFFNGEYHHKLDVVEAFQDSLGDNEVCSVFPVKDMRRQRKADSRVPVEPEITRTLPERICG